MGLADDVVPAIVRRYPGGGVQRVVDLWERVRLGKPLAREWEDKGSQVAASYIEGLYTEPWHDVHTYPWISALEGNASVIRDELCSSCSEEFDAGDTWVPAAGEDAGAYGGGWRKLALQNRVWDAAACELFPHTRAIIEESGVPSVDVFFAKQKAGSGITPHTGNTNFFITVHLGLRIPDRDCWIQVGKKKREWVEAKSLVFDSSFVHSTRNDGTSDRTVLVVKFWHPQITSVERDALEFIFSALDDPSILKQSFVACPEEDLGGDSEMQMPLPIDSIDMDSEPQEPRGADSLSADTEAARLDGFLADLKADGLLPGVSTPEEVLAQGPTNRDARRKAVKKRKRRARSGKGRVR